MRVNKTSQFCHYMWISPLLRSRPMNREALRLREEAALMRRVASIPTGDTEVDRELLALADSLEDQARFLETRPSKKALRFRREMGGPYAR